MSATMSVVSDRYSDALRRGAIIVDRSDLTIQPYVVSLLEHDVTDGRAALDGQPRVVLSARAVRPHRRGRDHHPTHRVAYPELGGTDR